MEDALEKALVLLQGENEIPVEFDLLEILGEVTKEEQLATVAAGVSKTQINVKNSHKLPSFHNCHIGTMNFNIVQK